MVVNMVDPRTSLGRQMVGALRREFSGVLCKTMVQRTVRLGEAMTAHQPVVTYDAQGPAAAAYRALATELLEDAGVPDGH
jgi:chromosome partitioning protein